MASNRSVIRAVARASSSYASRSSIAQYTTSTRITSAQPITPIRRAHIPRTIPPQRRLISSTPTPSSEIYDFEKVPTSLPQFLPNHVTNTDWWQIKSLSTHPSPTTTLLIDVREPHEYAQGFIPTALNLPIQSQPDALFLTNEEFEDRFGFGKPGEDVEVVFYCKAGVRSRAAAELARLAGYRVVGEYPGSWIDWVGRGGV